MKKTYQISERVWLYKGEAGWHFITLPIEVSQDIDFYFSMSKRGWGSLPVQVSVGETTWKTSIFPDKKSGTYLLPLKAAVRKKEQIEIGNEVVLTLEISD